ncbi:TIGR02147 family protein [Bdellovibrionales bacterium]|nr:TIGR02147 family protein [Bdellovibrionales bacterium]
MKSIFSFLSYKQYLYSYLSNQPKRGYGLRSIWAEKLGCNLAYLSRVLNKEAQLSVEQALELSELLKLGSEERDFFLLLVRKDRAGSFKLKSIIESEINEILSKRSLLRNRIEIKTKIDIEAQAKFYSSWLYSAIHMALTLEDINSKHEISEYFGISVNKSSEILDFLEEIGLISIINEKVTTLENQMFLGSDSNLISMHHKNWRIKALEEMSEINRESIHYSTVFTFSKEDYPRIKEILIKAIEDARNVVGKTAKEDEITCLNLDFFKL